MQCKGCHKYWPLAVVRRCAHRDKKLILTFIVVLGSFGTYFVFKRREIYGSAISQGTPLLVIEQPSCGNSFGGLQRLVADPTKAAGLKLDYPNSKLSQCIAHQVHERTP